MTPLQIGKGYCIFANGGFRVTPYFIDRIEDQSHHLLFQAKPSRACQACVENLNPSVEQILNKPHGAAGNYAAKYLFNRTSVA